MVQYVFIKRNTELARIFWLDVMKKKIGRGPNKCMVFFFGGGVRKKMIKTKPITRFYVELFTKSDKYLALEKSNWHLKAIVIHVTIFHKWKSMAGICSCQIGEKRRSINLARWCKIIILWNKCIFFSSFYCEKCDRRKTCWK